MRETPNPRVIEWALKRCNKTPDDCKSISKRVQQWIDGEGKGPTAKQLEKLATKTHVLLPYFYEDDIPNLELQIPDYRTLNGSVPATPSPELYDIINQMLSRQDWLSEYLSFCGKGKLELIGACHGSTDWAACAATMRDLLDLQPGWAHNLQRGAAVRTLRDAIERNGVFVYAGSYFGNSTNRKFDVQEFRGFVLCDDYAPVIFLNTGDAASAQLFTLTHEFAHLLFNETGVDDMALDFPKRGKEKSAMRLLLSFLFQHPWCMPYSIK